MTPCRPSIAIAIVLGIIVIICMIISITLLIKQKDFNDAFDPVVNNSFHCIRDETGSPNCSGPTCSNDNKICLPPYETIAASPTMLNQIDNILSPSPPISNWGDINQVAPYIANLISSMERHPQIHVPDWTQKEFLSPKYSPPDFPLGKIFYNNPNGTIFIIMRGTMAESLEWDQDLKYQLIAPSIDIGVKGKVHQGFMEIFEDIKNQIDDILLNITNIQNVVIAGHSLGGALAILIGLYLIYKDSSRKILCGCFGSPRVGDIEFADSVQTIISTKNLQIYRFSNIADIAIEVPLPVMPNFNNNEDPYKYKHVGKEFSYARNWGSYSWNHYMNNYIQAMKSPSLYSL